METQKRKEMTQQYVTFLFPGSFMPEEQQVKIKSREAKFEIPGNCFAYYFWEREEVEKGGETLYGGQKNKSGRFYFGTEMNAKEVEALVPDCRILLSNMRINGWKTVVKTRRGNFQPIEPGDVILNP